MDGMGMGMGMGMMMGMGLIGLIVLGLAIFGIVWLVRQNETSKRLPTVESPEELLRRRYAAGEMDADEYEHRRAGLRN